MTGKNIVLTEKLHEYLLQMSLRESTLKQELREETSGLEMARMQIAPEQGQFMALLAHLINARRVIEIGVFTGYSALCVAEVLPHDGQLLACDVSREWTDIARGYWKRAGVDQKIDLRLGPALDTLDVLLQDAQAATFDMAFIDADKTNYEQYYERLLKLLRSDGLIVIDNVLWSGAVADDAVQDEDTKALRAFNRKLKDDDRVMISMLPMADGLTLAVKR